MKIKLAVLGCGNMGSAIALGLAKKSTGFDFHTYTPTFTRAEALATKVGGKAAKTVNDLKGCEYFLVACKPQQFEDLSAQLKNIVDTNSKIISVMAGIPSQKIQAMLGCRKVARAMPNTPCLVGEGACAIYFANMEPSEIKKVEEIFAAVAETHQVSSDDAMDMVTAGIASGSGFLFEMARIFSDKLASMGLDAKTAEQLVKQMFKGSSELMLQSQDSLAELRNKVTSKKGTTEAGLHALQAGNLEKTLGAALDAAYQRAKELSRQ